MKKKVSSYSNVSLSSDEFELTHQGYDILKTERIIMQSKGGLFIPCQWSVDCYTAIEDLANFPLNLKMCISFNILVPHLEAILRP